MRPPSSRIGSAFRPGAKCHSVNGGSAGFAFSKKGRGSGAKGVRVGSPHGRASGLTRALNSGAMVHRAVQPRARETRLDSPLWAKQPRAVSERTAEGRALCIAQPDQPIVRSLQQQEECPVSLVVGGVSAAFRAPHDDIPGGRAHAPSPSSAALVQKRFKNWKFIRHHGRDLIGFLGKKVSEDFRKICAAIHRFMPLVAELFPLLDANRLPKTI